MEWELRIGVYRCIDCGEAMISLVKYDEEEPSLILREEPVACPRCTPYVEAIKRLAEALSQARHPLFEQLRSFY
jgi:DNA-directed RNA polymerase subunit RPC12/RpoP